MVQAGDTAGGAQSAAAATSASMSRVMVSKSPRSPGRKCRRWTHRKVGWMPIVRRC